MASPSPLHRPTIVPITASVAKTVRHHEIRFRHDALATSVAGTFCMVWIPGVDEVPMGTGPTEGDEVLLLVEGKGDATKALNALQPGTRIGLRGPFGHGFELPSEGRVCFVGGGTGVAPMARGVQQAMERGLDTTIITGARSGDLVLMDDWMSQQVGLHYHPCTNDGSFGFEGFTTVKLQALLDAGEQFDLIVACGPEPMMVAAKQVADRARIPYQASLERYMKCAVGICDACTVGEGVRICMEGPVLRGGQLDQVPEFGVSHRDAAGVPHPW